MYIDDAEGLRALVDSLAGAPVLALDTEFLREKTYFAKLCLIQIGTGDVSAIIDPLAVRDLEPLWELLRDPATMKVLHAGSQDLEIIARLMGEPPSPVFDTQVAATLAGHPTQVGYGALVQAVLGVEIDKGDTFTDWSRRPLASSQIEYALNDVRYLPEVYRRLRDELERGGRLPWLAEDFERLADPATYAVEPREQWRRVKRASTLDRQGLAVLRELAAWRETEAQRRDIPKRWVLADESLVEVARRAPSDEAALADIRGVSGKVAGHNGRAVLAAVAAGLAVPESERPRLERHRRPGREAARIADLMGVLVRLRAHEHGVASSLLASHDELERVAAGEGDAPVMTGWRRTLVGAELELLLAGRIALRVKDGSLMVETV